MGIYTFWDTLDVSSRKAMLDHRPLRGKRIVITGKLEDGLSRSDAQRLLTDFGALCYPAVDALTDILLAVDPTRMTVKRKEADRLDIPVLDEGAFVLWLRGMRDSAVEIESLLTAPPVPWTDDDSEYQDTIKPLSDFGR